MWFPPAFRTLAAVFLLAVGQPLVAQVTSIEVVVDTAFYGPNTPTPEDTFDPAGELDGYVSYLVYVNMTNPTDVLSAVFADTFALPQGGALGINAECECWNPVPNPWSWMATTAAFCGPLSPLAIRHVLDNRKAELGHAR